MTIILEIKPELQDQLSRQAAAHGVGLDSYATSLLEEAVRTADVKKAATPVKGLAELFAPLRGLNLDFASHPDFGRDIEL